MSELMSKPMAYKKPVMSVGEEFVAWAETYWRLEQLFDNSCKNPAEKGGETCPYSAIKPIFIKKINDIINQRVNDYL